MAFSYFTREEDWGKKIAGVWKNCENVPKVENTFIYYLCTHICM